VKNKQLLEIRRIAPGGLEKRQGAELPGYLTRSEMERRRIAAADVLRQGVRPCKVADQFGVSRTTASRWRRALRYAGITGMRSRKAKGRTPKLSAAELAEVTRLFHVGPKGDDGYWTAIEFRELIVERFGIRYHVDHVGRLMHRLGWREGAAAGGGK